MPRSYDPDRRQFYPTAAAIRQERSGRMGNHQQVAAACMTGAAMTTEIDAVRHTKVYTTPDGHTVIEQSQGSVVFSADQIQAVIKELHACYDYCALWKESMAGQDRAATREIQP
jgi:hypothetical protein